MEVGPLSGNTERMAMKEFMPNDWRPNPIWLTRYQTEQTIQNRRKARRVIAIVFIGLAIAATTIAVGNAGTKAIAELALHNVTQAAK